MVKNQNKIFSIDELLEFDFLKIDAEIILFNNGVFNDKISTVKLKKNSVEIDSNFQRALHVINVFDGGEVFKSPLNLKISDNVSVEIVESFVDISDEKTTVGASDISYEIGADCCLKNIKFFSLIENEINCNYMYNVNGDGSVLDVKGVYFLNGKSKLKMVISEDLKASNIESNIFVRGMVDGQSKTDIKIESICQRNLHKNSINQDHKSLILSDDASVRTEPVLKIFSEDVIAEHGFANYKMDEAEKFFLHNRGVGQKDSEEILKGAFFQDFLNKIENKNIKSSLESEFKKFYDLV